jgi:hypothetical protein
MLTFGASTEVHYQKSLVHAKALAIRLEAAKRALLTRDCGTAGREIALAIAQRKLLVEERGYSGVAAPTVVENRYRVLMPILIQQFRSTCVR